MNRALALCSAGSLALVLAASPALAQQSTPPAASTKPETYGYVFRDDPLNAGGFDVNDVQIRVLRHGMRTTLIRPRTDFVPEMIVSVEKL